MKDFNAHGHQYRFDSPQLLRYRDPSGGECEFPYREKIRLRVSAWTGRLHILRAGFPSAPLHPLPPEQLLEFLLEFFRSWGRVDPDAAKKAAFDYLDAQRGFVALAFAACLLVSFPVAVAMLADSHQQFRCTRSLREHSVPGTMEVVKARKRDSRTFLLHLEFTAPDGRKIRGQEEIVTEKDVNPPSKFAIAYAPGEPECWSLTKGPDSQEINWAKRRYFAAFALLLGLFFLAATFLGLAWCTVRWLRPRPFAREVGELFGLRN
jgi:hypothetical protein